jgi:hypothetical protein
MKRMISKLLNRGDNGNNTVDVKHLTKLVRRYAIEQQQVPKDLLDLVAQKYLTTIPIPPAGQRFVIDRRKVEVKLE